MIDEAFMDATPSDSLSSIAGTEDAPNLLVCVRLGYFSVAGARVGFLIGAPDLLGDQRRSLPVEILRPSPLRCPSRIKR